MDMWQGGPGGPRVRPVPQQRIREKLDDYMSRRDYPGAERHLLYWLAEAREGHDQRGELMIYWRRCKREKKRLNMNALEGRTI